MGVKKFDLVMDSPVIYAGQNISGKLLVDVEKPIKMRGIRLNYSGKGSVHWSEGSNKNRRTYSSKETYLELQQLVSGSYEDESELAEGQYVFVFSCPLPRESPSSYEGLYGRVKYYVKATLDLPWQVDPTAKELLTVVTLLDLNQVPGIAAPISEQISKNFWGQSKPLFMSYNLPITGYVPGQIIPVKITLNNESKVEVKRITAELVQEVMFHATTKSRTSKTSLWKNAVPLQNGFGVMEAFLRIKVPPLPPSFLQFCNIIDIGYNVTVSAEVGVLHADLDKESSIVIGNVPLMTAQQLPETSQQVLPKPIDPENPSNYQSSSYRPPPYNIVSPQATLYGNLSPPSYEQCIGLGKSEREKPSDDSDSDSEVKRFAPLYPVFNFKE